MNFLFAANLLYLIRISRVFNISKNICNRYSDTQVLMRALGFDVKKADVIKIVHDIDPSNEGTVVYEQFLEIMVRTISLHRYKNIP